jgi:hypothetical protein
MSSGSINRVDAQKEIERPRPASMPSGRRHQYPTIMMALATTFLMSFTIFFAYNSSLQKPMLSLFVSKSPERSILILNIASQISLFALAEMECLIYDAVRWVLASHRSGTPGLTFITLGRATGLLGSIYLSFSRSRVSGKAQVYNDHRLWGVQRSLLP